MRAGIGTYFLCATSYPTREPGKGRVWANRGA